MADHQCQKDENFAFVKYDVTSYGHPRKEITAREEEARLKLTSPLPAQSNVRPIPEGERTHTRILDNFTLWLSANCSAALLIVGCMGTEIFHLGFWEGMTCILVANIVAIIPGAYFSTFGNRYGMPQMVLTRYSFGAFGVAVPVVINAFLLLGTGIITLIFASQILNAAVYIPTSAGVVLVSSLVWATSVAGYQVVHEVERWMWALVLAGCVVLAWIGLPEVVDHIQMPGNGNAGAADDIGNRLSFITMVVSCYPILYTSAADFSTKQPAAFDPWMVGGLSMLGAFVPAVCLEGLGLALMGGVRTHSAWARRYAEQGAGGLLESVLAPLGIIGNLVLVILAISTVGGLAPIQYSIALSLESLCPRIRAHTYNTLMAVTYTAISLGAADLLLPLLQGFTSLVAYMLGPYAVIVFLEHIVFRCAEYPLDIWDKPHRLPLGIAATTAILVGFFGAFLGMHQPWFVGPVARRIDHHGADVGLWIAVLVSGCYYLWFRKIEIIMTRR